LQQRLHPGIAASFEPEWQNFIETRGSGGQGSNEDIPVALLLQNSSDRSMQIGSFMNP